MYIFSTVSSRTLVLPSSLPAIVAVIALVLFVTSKITIIDFYYAFFGAFALSIVLLLILLRAGKKLPPGSSKSEWEQSGAKVTFYDWSKVSTGILNKGFRNSGPVLSMVIGDGMKSRRNYVFRLDSSQSPQDLAQFLSEKMGDHFASRI